MTIQFYLTPAAGKRLIAKGIVQLEEVKDALENGTVLVVGSTTGSYVAEELLKAVGEDTDEFDRRAFFRGITVPKGFKYTPREYIGDVVIRDGKWIKGLTSYDVCGNLKKGDVMFKGANAVNLEDGQAGILLGSENMGSSGPVITAVYGKRVKLIVPVGVEKRVTAPIKDLADMCDSPDATGLKFMPLPGDVFTELHAIELLTGAYAEILAAGGVCGAEGGCYFLADGEEEQIEKLRELISEVETEEPFTL